MRKKRLTGKLILCNDENMARNYGNQISNNSEYGLVNESFCGWEKSVGEENLNLGNMMDQDKIERWEVDVSFNIRVSSTDIGSLSATSQFCRISPWIMQGESWVYNCSKFCCKIQSFRRISLPDWKLGTGRSRQLGPLQHALITHLSISAFFL